jgi:PAS domain S-box-containing protein
MTPEEFRHLDELAIEELQKTGVAAPWEKEYVRKDGSRVPILVGVAMLDDAEGESVAFVLDLTEKKRAAEAIRNLREEHAADAKFRALLEAAPDAMVIVDERGQVVLVNAQTESLFGYSRTELLDRPVEILIPARFRDLHPEHRAEYTASPRAPAMGSGLDLRGRRKDGSEFAVEISLSPIQTADGLLISSAIRDVTERNRIEAALKNANRELEAFSYSVAHDLRAPLRAMSGFAQVLLEEHANHLDDEGKDCLAEITANAVKMGSLIDALLALARVSRVELKTERIDLAGLLRATASRLAADDPSRTLQVVAPSAVWVDLDANLARTLVENLMENAWKFTRGVSGAKVELGTTRNNGRAAFFVRDNGVGFDMTYASKLFAPFQRLHSSSEFPGTGIGLATVQRILHRHGGSIWAEGAVGRGATFYFALPGAPGEMAS